MGKRSRELSFALLEPSVQVESDDDEDSHSDLFSKDSSSEEIHDSSGGKLSTSHVKKLKLTQDDRAASKKINTNYNKSSVNKENHSNNNIHSSTSCSSDSDIKTNATNINKQHALPATQSSYQKDLALRMYSKTKDDAKPSSLNNTSSKLKDLNANKKKKIIAKPQKPPPSGASATNNKNKTVSPNIEATTHSAIVSKENSQRPLDANEDSSIAKNKKIKLVLAPNKPETLPIHNRDISQMNLQKGFPYHKPQDTLNPIQMSTLNTNHLIDDKLDNNGSFDNKKSATSLLKPNNNNLLKSNTDYFYNDELSLENRQNVDSASSNNNSAVLFAEVLCKIADFTTSLALFVSNRTKHEWKPQILEQRDDKKSKKKSIKSPNEPKKPLSSYNLWCEHTRKKFKESDPSRVLKITDLAEMWKNLPDKAEWERAAKESRAKYLEQLEIYRALENEDNHFD